LASREDCKLRFDLEPKIGVWFIDEIYLAMQNGYIVDEIYQIYHWDIENRSQDYMKGYMSFFLRGKQESDGWPWGNQEVPIEQKQARIEELYMKNGSIAKMRIDRVAKNDVQRKICKLYCNCLWGKFAQDVMSQCSNYIHTYKQLLELHQDPLVNKTTVRFRHVAAETYHVMYEQHKDTIPCKAFYNVWMAAAVPAWGRIHLHQRMLEINRNMNDGNNILYCDTDSVFFRYNKQFESLAGEGLGNWVNEEPNKCITHFYGLAPKAYQYVFSNGDRKIKTKGVVMTIPNKNKLTTSAIENLIKTAIWEKYSNIPSSIPLLTLDHFTIFKNSTNSAFNYGEMFSRYSQKQVKAVFTKRALQIPEILCNDHDLMNEEDYMNKYSLTSFKRVITLPFGYEL
jgi:hypothetical protein